MNEKRKISSSPLCLISALVWGISFPMQEIASKSSYLLDTFGFTGFRMLIAALALIPMVLLFERHADYSKKRVVSTVKYSILAGVILFSASVFQQLGIEMTGESGKAGFITSLYLIFVPIIAFALFRQKPSYLVLAAMPFAVCGLYFLSFSNGFGAVETGDLMVLACSLLYSCHIIVFDKSSKCTNPFLFSGLQFFVAGILSLSCGFIFGTVTAKGIAATALPMVYCGIFSVAIAYTCQLLGQKNGNPTVCALFCSMEALFAVIAECIIEGHLPTYKMVIGCVLMLLAVVLAQLPQDIFKRKKASPKE